MHDFLKCVTVTLRAKKVSFTSESTWKNVAVESLDKHKKEDGTHWLKCSKKLFFFHLRIFLYRLAVGPWTPRSYTVLCLLSRLRPMFSEEWRGNSMNIPSESEPADSSTCPIMVSGLDDWLDGVGDAPMLRSVTVVVASVPWRAPEEWRMEGDDRVKSMAPAPVKETPLGYYGFYHRNQDGCWRPNICHTVELRAHTQSVRGGTWQLRARSQVRVGQSLFLQAWNHLTRRVAPNSSAAHGAGVWVILGHRGQQQRDIVAFWSYHRVFRWLVCRPGPAPRQTLVWKTREGFIKMHFGSPQTQMLFVIPAFPTDPKHSSDPQPCFQSKAHGCPGRVRPPSEPETPTVSSPHSHHGARGPPEIHSRAWKYEF